MFFWRILLCAGALLSLPYLAQATDVALVVEDNKILQQITQGFQSRFKGSVETFLHDSRASSETDRKIRESSPRLIVALGSSAAKEARDRFPTAALLYGGVLNPRKVGLSGNNVNGVPMAVPIKRQWQIALKGIKAWRMGVLLSAENKDIRSEAEEAAKELGLRLKIGTVSQDDLAAAIKALDDEVDAVWIPLDPAVAQQAAFKAIVDFCLKRKIPLIVPVSSYVKQGGLMSVSLDYSDMGRLLASQAETVLSGSSPRAAAGQASGEEEITVNLAVAREIGLTLSPEFLRGAAKKIE